MLLGESGLGKGFPINRAKLLVQKANITRVIAGRSSIQAIVQELSRTRTQEGKPLITDSRGYIVNGELSTAIIQDPDSLTILTDLYDGHYNPEWTNLLKGDGAEKLKNPYITALFGSSPAHFYDSIPQANIEGGYIGRNLIIYEEKRSKDVDLLGPEDEEVQDNKFDDYLLPKYIPHLENISKKRGRLVPEKEASELFNIWRRDWRTKQKADRTGFLNRVPDHVMKVAICLSLSHYDFNGEISSIDMQEAIDKVIHLIYSNKRTTEGRGPDPLAVGTKAVLDYLLASPELQLFRKQLLWKGYGQYNSFTFDQIMDNLLEMKWITRERIGVGSNADWLIKLSGEPKEEYLKFKEGKSGKR
jgi:hypothetical protein